MLPLTVFYILTFLIDFLVNLVSLDPLFHGLNLNLTHRTQFVKLGENRSTLSTLTHLILSKLLESPTTASFLSLIIYLRSVGLLITIFGLSVISGVFLTTLWLTCSLSPSLAPVSIIAILSSPASQTSTCFVFKDFKAERPISSPTLTEPLHLANFSVSSIGFLFLTELISKLLL